MKPEAPPELQRLLAPEPVVVEEGPLSASATACLHEVLRLNGARPSQKSQTGPRIVTFTGLSALTPTQVRALRAATLEHPLFICPATAGAAIDTASLASLADVQLHASAPVSVSRYAFAQQAELWPFSGMELTEDEYRTVSALTGEHTPLITAEHGDVFLRIGYGKGIYVSTVSLPEEPENGLLKNELEPSRFMGLLPLVLFLRTALEEHRWRTPTLGATFMIDDPNLRRSRYGFVDLERLIDESEQHDFHASIAMIPLDYRKTRPYVAELMRRHSDRVSLVMHGVDHVWGEFNAKVSLAEADEALAQGLARMDAHEWRTGLRYARAQTVPYGLCSVVWMEAMRNAGLDAAILTRSFPFLTEAEIDDPLYELHPAQMTFRGLPVVNRFKAEKRRERLLFQAVLGKPLMVYTHHTFFKEGTEGLIEIAHFLNRHVGPRWGSVDDILRSNYQVRHRAGHTLIRAFSNRISVPSSDSQIIVVKPGRDIPADEICTVGTSSIEPMRVAEGLVLPVSSTDGHEVLFRPVNTASRSVRRMRLKSRARRIGTEVRDQLVMPGTAALADARQRIGRRWR